jgi:hypothetical protein
MKLSDLVHMESVLPEWMPEILHYAGDPIDVIMRRVPFGYHCSECDCAYMIPANVRNRSELETAMRHDCEKTKAALTPESIAEFQRSFYGRAL